MKRGEIVIAAERGRLSAKPRPWLVVQSDAYNALHPSLTLCLITSMKTGAVQFRIAVQASTENGLDEASEVMVDKLVTLSRESIVRVVGTLEPAPLADVDAALRRWLDL
ncbi:MAG TPA: type II toxin-antitoxin system PemK/MazF family toxin [Allosphingosinicella sp.]